MEESTGIFTFADCEIETELFQKNDFLQRNFFESYLDIKSKLIQNLELVIDEQEGRIDELRQAFKAATGRSSPLIFSERKMLKGISHLSFEFGELSDENLQLKEELRIAELENRRLQIKLNSTITNYSQLPLLVDDETQTESDQELTTPTFKTKKVSDEDSLLQDTEEEFLDDSASETTASSLNPESNNQLVQENEELIRRLNHLESELKNARTAKISSEAAFSRLLQRYEEEVSLRKALHDALVQLRGNIRVFCRIKPSVESVKVVENDSLDCDAITVSTDSGIKRFLFDRVFNENADQIDLYNEVEPLVLSCLDGMNVCIFAYGQTGSGKTFTMDGPETNPGIGQRALIQIFQVLEAKKEQVEFSIQVSLIEIYNEKIRDLLDPSSQKLELKMDKDGRQKINNLSKHFVDSVDKVQNILESGRKNRSVAATALNDQSSRSHAVVMIEISMTDNNSKTKSFGKLNLIDLAGSERVSKSQVSGPQLKEAQHINKSLSELGNVVSALRRKQTHVPFRNCLLTRILEDSLDGDSKTLMIVQVAAERPSVQESISSLNFAEKISNVTRRTQKILSKKS